MGPIGNVTHRRTRPRVWARVSRGLTGFGSSPAPDVWSIHRLRSVGDRYLGLRLEPGGEPPTVLSSRDGRSWDSVGPEFFSLASDVVQLSDRLLLVGRGLEADGPMAVAIADDLAGPWTRQPTEPLFSQALVLSLAIAPAGDSLVGVGSSINGSAVFVLPLP